MPRKRNYFSKKPLTKATKRTIAMLDNQLSAQSMHDAGMMKDLTFLQGVWGSATKTARGSFSAIQAAQAQRLKQLRMQHFDPRVGLDRNTSAIKSAQNSADVISSAFDIRDIAIQEFIKPLASGLKDIPSNILGDKLLAPIGEGINEAITRSEQYAAIQNDILMTGEQRERKRYEQKYGTHYTVKINGKKLSPYDAAQELKRLKEEQKLKEAQRKAYERKWREKHGSKTDKYKEMYGDNWANAFNMDEDEIKAERDKEKEETSKRLWAGADERRSKRKRKQFVDAQYAMMDDDERERREYKKKYGKDWEKVYLHNMMKNNKLLTSLNKWGFISAKQLPKLASSFKAATQLPGVGPYLKLLAKNPVVGGVVLAAESIKGAINYSESKAKTRNMVSYYGSAPGAFRSAMYASGNTDVAAAQQAHGQGEMDLAGLNYGGDFWNNLVQASVYGYQIPPNITEMSYSDFISDAVKQAGHLDKRSAMLMLSTLKIDPEKYRVAKLQNTPWGSKTFSERFNLSMGSIHEIEQRGGFTGGLMKVLNTGNVLGSVYSFLEASAGAFVPKNWAIEQYDSHLIKQQQMNTAAESLTSAQAVSSAGQYGNIIQSAYEHQTGQKFVVGTINVQAENVRGFVQDLASKTGMDAAVINNYLSTGTL